MGAFPLIEDGAPLGPGILSDRDRIERFAGV
jgi:hypothetical protein